MRCALQNLPRPLLTIICSVCLCVAAPGGNAQSPRHEARSPQRKVSPPTLTPTAGALMPTRSFAPTLAKVIPAVVTIRVIGATPVPVELPPRKPGSKPEPLPAPRTEPYRAGGSGIIVDAARGYILTNNHVIENATWIQVGLSDGRSFMAELVGRDIGSDVAVLKIKPDKLPSMTIGDSDEAQVGDIVMAVGNPFGLESTATMGIVSGVMRTEVGHGAFEDYLQIDASINPGNSGGALVNIDGELIGINTAGPGNGKSAGIGFAIPINMAMMIKNEIIAAGRIRRGSPGIVVEDLPPEMAMREDGSVIRGALVTKVLPNSPAAAAGISPGDIVVGAANKPVRSAAEFTTRTVTVPLGSQIPFILFSHGHGRLVKLTSSDLVIEPAGKPIPAQAGSIAGAVVGEILLGNPLFGELRGAQVMSVPADAPAFAAGLEDDDVIVRLDGTEIWSVDDLVRSITRAGTQYRIDIVRGGAPWWLRVSR